MIQPMAPETLERLMAEAPTEAIEQQLECEAHANAVQITRSLIAAYGPEGAERIARQLVCSLARELEVARPDDVSGSLFGLRPS